MISENQPGRMSDATHVLRLTALVLIWAAEVLTALYAGIGYTILIGYTVFAVFLIVLIREKWFDSRFGRFVYGKISRPEIEKFLRELSRSRSYKVTAAVTIVVLLAVTIIMLTSLNFRLIELF